MSAAIPPPWPWLPLELRALGEWLTPLAFRRDMRRWPRGDGQPVMVYPGFGQDDGSTRRLRAFLRQQGFRVQGWGQHRNWGMRKGMTGALLQQAEAMASSSGVQPALVGWSLGGVFARELARKRPELFSHVISLGSPIGGGDSTTIDAMFRRLNPGPRASQDDIESRWQAPPLPCTAIYSRSDGIVAWRASLEKSGAHIENIGVRGSHLGLGNNPLVWYACAHRLSPDTRHDAFSWPAELRWAAPSAGADPTE